VEAGKNLRNAVVSMPKICFIGSSTLKKEYRKALILQGHTITKFKSLDTALPKLNKKADLLIIDKEQNIEPSFKELLKLTKNIPKILILDSSLLRGYIPWLNEPLICPICAPTVKELGYLVNRLLKVKEILLENDKLKNDLSTVHHELNFFEEVTKTLTSSSDLNDILTTIMKKAKDIAKAETWSVFLVDHETGELVFEKRDAKKTRKIQRLRLKIGEGISGWVAEKGIPIIVQDVS